MRRRPILITVARIVRLLGRKHLDRLSDRVSRLGTQRRDVTLLQLSDALFWHERAQFCERWHDGTRALAHKHARDAALRRVCTGVRR